MKESMFGLRREDEKADSLQDRLTGALVGLARASDGNSDLLTGETDSLVQQALGACCAYGEEKAVEALIEKVHAEKARLVPDCSSCTHPCGHNDDYDMAKLWNAGEDTRSLKELILYSACILAGYTLKAGALGYRDLEISRFFYRALFILGEEADREELLAMVEEIGQNNRKAMALLAEALCETQRG